MSDEALSKDAVVFLGGTAVLKLVGWTIETNKESID